MKTSKKLIKCKECGNEMIELEAKTSENVSYAYFRCKKCGDEIVDKQQLHNVAEKYRIQLPKMKEVWDNKEDEAWENA